MLLVSDHITRSHKKLNILTDRFMQEFQSVKGSLSWPNLYFRLLTYLHLFVPD